MTKYILHGGMDRPESETNKAYYREIVGKLKNPKILLVYFAREESERASLNEKYKHRFAWANPGVKCEFMVATEENFAAEIAQSDVIYFCGGSSQKLINTIKHLNLDLKDLLKNKIVVGSSAGADLISDWFYTHSGKEIRQGLALLPITTFNHYRPPEGSMFWLSAKDTKSIEQDLLSRTPHREVIKLPEQNFIIISS